MSWEVRSASSMLFLSQSSPSLLLLLLFDKEPSLLALLALLLLVMLVWLAWPLVSYDMEEEEEDEEESFILASFIS